MNALLAPPTRAEVIPVAQTLTTTEENEARKLYEEFWRMYPTQKNPTDINTPQKANFLILKGFEKIRLMQRARKQKYDFTRPDEPEDAGDE